MCGRFAFYSPDEAASRLFGVSDAPELEPRYNIAPTQFAPVVRQHDGGVRRIQLLRWGLVPFWAKDKSIGNRMINARAETLATKPAYRDSYRKRRCLVPANGFFEWQKRGGLKQPFFISLGATEPFAMAGLWASWRSKEDPEQRLESFTIVTTTPADAISALHDRMPVIVSPQDYSRWLDPDIRETDALESLLVPCQSDRLQFWPVSREVNDPRNEGPGLVESISLV